MRRKVTALLCLTALLMVAGCGDDDNPVVPRTIEGSGDLVTVERNLGNFHSIINAAPADVNITMGMSMAATIRVDDNILEYVVTTVSGGVLTITIDPEVSVSNIDLTIDVYMADLKRVVLSGVGNISTINTAQVDSVDLVLSGAGNFSFDIDVDYLQTLLPGAGNVILYGYSMKHLITHSGVGNINAFGLTTDSTTAVLSGVGNASVYADDYLDVILSGIGSLYYRGAPTVSVIVTGTGEVVDAN